MSGSFGDSALPSGPLDQAFRSRLGLARWAHHLRLTEEADVTDPATQRRLAVLLGAGAVVCGRTRTNASHPFSLTEYISNETPADLSEREARSVGGRRAALLMHGTASSVLPSVSVIVPTRRPEQLPHVAEGLERQRGIIAEVVFGAHGWTPSAHQLETLDRATSGMLVICTTDSSLPLGRLLNRLVERASGELVVKWDDDDHYGPHHLVDLVLAHAYSGADLTGKGAEFVYLPASDMTVHRRAGGGESFSKSISGSTLTFRAATAREVGGFAAVGIGEDTDFVARVEKAGGTIYRTHGREFVVQRRSDATWRRDERSFLREADAVRAGLFLPDTRPLPESWS